MKNRLFQRALIATSAVALVACALLLLWTLRVIVIDVILAITVASSITPLAETLEKKGLSRLFTVICTYLLVIAFYTAVAFAIAGPFKEQASLFVEQIPHYTAELRDTYNQLLIMLGDKASLLTVHADDLRTPALNMVGRTLNFTAGLMGFSLNTILVLFLAAYFVVQADYIWTHLLLWLPSKNRKRAANLINPLASRMGGYIRGQILVSTAVAAFFSIGLTLIGVKYGLVLGLLGGLLNLLPFVGSIITTILALFVAANQSLLTCALTALLFVVEQACESNFIVPYLLGKQVDMHPLVVLLAILIGATLAGGIGALAAVPICAALLYLAQEFYFKPLQESQADPTA
ncbi:MAG: AI-2E family transporter [Candidatus Obscuribacterales bacterium]|jgi:predicted PurR-regulated permease PerM|nr:AI-2E family transporter [Candidatus Obscuribacterales bacterium]